MLVVELPIQKLPNWLKEAPVPDIVVPLIAALPAIIYPVPPALPTVKVPVLVLIELRSLTPILAAVIAPACTAPVYTELTAIFCAVTAFAASCVVPILPA